jgi:O-antigen/teichoic acid export membrane protein
MIKIKYKKIVENFLSLSFLKMVTLVAPLFTFPYLLHTIGSEKYGSVIWVLSIVNFFIFFIKFGFDLTITKLISLNRNDDEKINSIVSNAFAAKLFLCLLSMPIYFLLIILIPSFNNNLQIFLLFSLMPIAEIFLSIWYFQGVEKMKYTGIVNGLVKIIFSMLVFLFIVKPDDYLKVPILYSLSSLVCGFIALYLVFIKEKVKFVKPCFNIYFGYIKNSYTVFLSTASSQIKDSVVIFLIGQYIDISAVAYYDVMQKFVNVIITPFHVLNQVVFPKITLTRDYNLLNKLLLISSIACIVLVCFIVIFRIEILSLLNVKVKGNDFVFNLLVINVFFMNLSSSLGVNFLLAFGMEKRFLVSTVWPIILLFISMLLCVYFNDFNLIYIGGLLMLSSAFELFLRFCPYLEYRSRGFS